MYQEVNLNLKNNSNKSYKVIISNQIEEYLLNFLNIKKYSKIFIITDDIISKLYLSELNNIITKFDKNLFYKNIIIANGEKSKNFTIVEKITDQLLDNNVNRDSLIIAFGGGVIGDISAFVASIILRSIDFIQIPTTLLAMTDSSVGGKTGINHKNGKNLIGSFYQPKLVLCNIKYLNSLSKREFLSGYAENIKHAIIADGDFFTFLENNLNNILDRKEDILSVMLQKSIAIKANIVAKDEKELSIRALLNFGHTFAHIFEKDYNYDSSKLKHGEAVALGIILASKLSYELSFLDYDIYLRIKNYISKSGFIDDINKLQLSNYNILLQYLYKDKKILNNKLRFILIKDIGNSFIYDNVSEKNIKNILTC